MTSPNWRSLRSSLISIFGFNYFNNCRHTRGPAAIGRINCHTHSEHMVGNHSLHEWGQVIFVIVKSKTVSNSCE